MTKPKVLEINLREIIRQRLPKQFPFIPRPLISALEKFIRQKEMNQLLHDTEGTKNAEFCDGVLRHLNISYSIVGAENIPSPSDPARVVFVSNHPLGGLDGMTLISIISKYTGKKVKFLVNDLLMAVEPLHDVFLPINKHGRQNRKALDEINNAFAGSDPIIIFPAGLCSRKQKNGQIADPVWQKTFINRCIQSKRNIIPVHFNARNSNFFYNFAKIRKLLHIPFNLEMTRLPAEVINSRNAHFTITFGKPVPFSSLKGGAAAQSEALEIRNLVYNLHHKN